jgi:LysM repeat protein
MRVQTLISRSLFILVALALVGATPGLAQEETNLLENPGFEGEYSTWWDGNTPYITAQMAPDWNPWWKAQTADDPSWRNRMPEWKGATPWQNRIRSGDNAQQFFSFYGTHVAGVYQRVTGVSAGDKLRFTIWAQVWSSAYDDSNVSEADGQVDMWVGIDPQGGTDPFSSNITWSDPVRRYDEWFLMSVEATAATSAVTVFVRSEPQYPVKHNDIYVDDALLVVIGQGTVPTAAVPTPTEDVGTVPTAEPTATPTTASNRPTSTPTTQTQTSTVIYTVVAGDTLLAIASRFGVTLDEIVAANNLADPNFLRIGQQLIIPNQTPTPAPATATPIPTTAPGVQPTAAPTAQPQQQTTHTVQAGENLYRIALRYSTTIETLAQLNGITNPNIIRVGQVLQVTPGTVQTPTTQPQSGGTGTQHVVQAGENAFRIALRYGTTIEAIAAANGISNPNLIFVGQVLVIP